MRKLDIKKSLEVNTNAAKVWELIGPEFLNISEWGRGVAKSWDNESAPKKFEEAPAGGRYCEVRGFGQLEENIIHYDNGKYEISWSAVGDKMPGFVSDLQNQIKVEAIDENTCRISSHLSANLNGLMGFLMGFMLKKNFNKLVIGFLNDWKTYAETGEVSETKKRELKKSA